MRLTLLILLSLLTTMKMASADEFDVLRLRWKETLTGGTNINLADPDLSRSLDSLTRSARSTWRSMETSATRSYLWPDLGGMTSNSAHITSTYGRLKTMALAFATRGTGYEGDAALRADLLAALDWMNANRYSKSKSAYGNWWDWEIGCPLALNDITVLLYDELTSAQVSAYMSAVNKFTPKPTKTAANRVWQSTVVVVRGVIVKSSSAVTTGRNGLSDVFPYVTKGDGFQADGSFLQHEIHPYNGGYGNSLLGSIVPVMFLLEGSTWRVTDASRLNVFRWLHDSYEPLVYNGAMMDMVRGREISRARSSDHAIGASVITSFLRAAQFAPATDAAAFRSTAKQWILSDTAWDFVGEGSVPAILLAKSVLDDPGIAASGERTGHFRFPGMDRVVHLRPGFGLGLSMSSARVASYESLNVENIHGWYTGEGMTYLYNGDLDQFSDGFWPTVDPYRLPGTTVDTQRRADASGESYLSTSKWAGGTTLGAFGVTGMQLDAWGSTLAAKKSWFMFDDEIVALGAGITCTDARAIETIVENRMLTESGDNPFLINGELQPASLPSSATTGNVSWAHLAGNGSGAEIGYYFPQPMTVKSLRESRTHSWYEINAKSGPTNLLTRNYQALWIDHGTKPANATYSYVLLPNKTPAEVAAYAASPDITILENSPSAQAVREARLGITAVNFWNDGSLTVAGITVDKKAAVMTQATSSELEVSVSDPTQANSKKINVELAFAATRLISADAGVTVTALAPKVKLTVNVKSARGRSFRAKFALPPAAPIGLALLGQAGVPALVDTNFSTSANADPNSLIPPPALTIQFAGADAILLSWPASLAGFRLQASSNPDDLESDDHWIDVPFEPGVPVLLPIDKTLPAVFYRLKSE